MLHTIFSHFHQLPNRIKVYDCNIEANAMIHAHLCTYRHSPMASRPYLGENLHWLSSTRSVSPEELARNVGVARIQRFSTWKASVSRRATGGLPSWRSSEYRRTTSSLLGSSTHSGQSDTTHRYRQSGSALLSMLAPGRRCFRWRGKRRTTLAVP